VEPHRPREFEDALNARRIRGYARRAKNVLIHLDRGETLRIQLGMTGHVYWIADHRQPPRFTRMLLRLFGGGGGIAFEDSRVFGSANLHPTRDLPSVFASYGPEPLDDGYTWQMLRDSARASRLPVKPFLLDQSRVVGLGNIWAAESCFRARLSPFRPVNRIETAEWKRLHAAIRRTLGNAIAATFKVTRAASDFPEADLLTCAVYGREGERCRKCKAAVERRTQAGRSTFFCPVCQPQ
jgi:formamidopyrimidine-DNA glycosylase